MTFKFKYFKYGIHNFKISSIIQITHIAKHSYPGTATFNVVLANGLALLVLPVLLLLMLPLANGSIL